MRRLPLFLLYSSIPLPTMTPLTNYVLQFTHPWIKKSEKTCPCIKVKGLNSEDGVNILLNKLKSWFSKDTNQAAYLAYDNFESCKKPVNTIFFINEFERQYNNIKKYEIKLTTGVLVYALLKSTGIATNKQLLTRATIASFSMIA